MKSDNINTAFEILLEEIEIFIDNLNNEGAAMLREGKYAAASRIIEAGTRLTEFREKVKALQKELASDVATSLRPEVKAYQAGKGRLARGLRTPEPDFRRPILETLVELGGKASPSEVLDRVGEKMKDVLKEYDYEPLPSDPKSVRWRNTAQWCRNTLVREGLMKSDSPHGVWEISDLGREELRKQVPPQKMEE